MAPTMSLGPPDSGGPANRQPVFTAGERAEYGRLRRHTAVRHRRVRLAGSSVVQHGNIHDLSEERPTHKA
nr:hypothetical protein OG781_08995 [Streptomyces sp. NBC_00830]